MRERLAQRWPYYLGALVSVIAVGTLAGVILFGGANPGRPKDPFVVTPRSEETGSPLGSLLGGGASGEVVPEPVSESPSPSESVAPSESPSVSPSATASPTITPSPS
jgi:hypothetical protein